jgi:hypothetical protein
MALVRLCKQESEAVEGDTVIAPLSQLLGWLYTMVCFARFLVGWMARQLRQVRGWAWLVDSPTVHFFDLLTTQASPFSISSPSRQLCVILLGRCG